MTDEDMDPLVETMASTVELHKKHLVKNIQKVLNVRKVMANAGGSLDSESSDDEADDRSTE